MGLKTFVKKNTLPALIRKLKMGESGMSVTIGVQGKDAGAKKEGGLTNVQVASYHEFGTENIPQRSFIRSNDEKNKAQYKKVIAEIKDKIIFGQMKVDQGLGLLGEKVRADIQAGIRAGIEPALSEKTIKAKGSSVPLIDTGQLIQAITYDVKGKKV